jgi:hypothetical protein
MSNDPLADGLISRQIASALSALERDAMSVAQIATQFAGPSIRVGMVAGEAARLAQYAQQLAQAAARLDAMREVADVYIKEEQG